jgi:thiol-disulfide isomerase/thioredoxin
MKLKLCFLLLLCLFFRVSAQDKNIKIGDKVPDIFVSNVINLKPAGKPVTSVHLSDFKGKLLILDFWATNCASCIEAVPRLDSLQKEFGDRLAILTVSYEKKALVRAFLERNHIGKTMRLPVATGDTLLQQLFPHRELSHEVWIDGGGKVIAITNVEYVDRKNISTYMDKGTVSLPLKSDVSGYDFSSPLIGGTAVPLFYSMVSAYKPGVPADFGVVRDTLNHRTRFWIINFPVLSMYLLAFDHLLYFPKTLMRVELRDSTLARVPAGSYRDHWKVNHYFCYEAVLPERAGSAKFKAALVSDLNRFFGLEGRMEKRLLNSLSLQRLPGGSVPLTKGGTPLNTLHAGSGQRMLVNASLSNLAWELNDLSGGLPATDDTGITGNVDLQLAGVSSFRDIPSLNAALRPYGLVLVRKMQALDMFVLSDARP